jgi:hypothetical protein
MAIRPKTRNSSAQIAVGIGAAPVAGVLCPDDALDSDAVVTVDEDFKVVVVAPVATVVVVVVPGFTVVVVAPDGAVVVVAAGAVVVVGVEPLTTCHVIPDGMSAGSTAKVNTAFQYLSSCVADAEPRVHANPTLYVPAGTICGPLAPKAPNEIVGIPVTNPPPPGEAATAVVLFTMGVPAPLNKGWRKLAPVPAGIGP